MFGKTFLGLTLACARCHDHKFDPIATKDYYSLFSVLASSRYNRADIDDPAPTAKLLDELKELRAQLASGGRSPLMRGIRRADAPRSPASEWREKSVAFEKFDADWRSRWDASGLAFRAEAGDGFPHSGREVRKLAGALRSPTFTIDKPYLAIRVAGRDGKARRHPQRTATHPERRSTAASRSRSTTATNCAGSSFDLQMWKGQPAYLELLDDGPGYVAIREAWFADSPPPADPAERVALAELPGIGQTGGEEARRAHPRTGGEVPEPRRAPTMRDGTGINEHVFVRGKPQEPRRRSSARRSSKRSARPPFAVDRQRAARTREGRHRPDEPARRARDREPALEASLRRGNRPLAGRLRLPGPTADAPGVARLARERNWSIQRAEVVAQAHAPADGALDRVPSVESRDAGTGREGGHGRPAEQALAPAERAAARSRGDPRRDPARLRAGSIATMEGPGVLPHLTEHQVGRGRPASGPLDGNGRRSVYLAVRRNFLNPMFSAFDYPTPFTTIGRRTVSNVPAQALVMLNNPFVLQQAELWAKRVLAVPNSSTEERVRAMYEAAFGRPPTKAELAAAIEFLADQSDEYGKPDHPKAWTDLAHVLFNTKEFIFVE